MGSVYHSGLSSTFSISISQSHYIRYYPILLIGVHLSGIKLPESQTGPAKLARPLWPGLGSNKNVTDYRIYAAYWTPRMARVP